MLTCRTTWNAGAALATRGRSSTTGGGRLAPVMWAMRRCAAAVSQPSGAPGVTNPSSSALVSLHAACAVGLRFTSSTTASSSTPQTQPQAAASSSAREEQEASRTQAAAGAGETTTNSSSGGGGEAASSVSPTTTTTTTPPTSSAGADSNTTPTDGTSTGTTASVPTPPAAVEATEKGVAAVDPEPERWIQTPFQDPELQPIVDEKGQYIVSKGNWPTGDVAYQTPPPPDKLAPRFGYNVLQVKKDVSWWKHYHKYPRFSFAYLNIQFFFLIGLAWLVAFLSTEYRRMTDELKTPGAMVGEHRGKGPVTKGTQKVTFTSDEMGSLLGHAQGNWMDAKGESNYIGSKDYRMKQISRPKEFSVEDFRKR